MNGTLRSLVGALLAGLLACSTGGGGAVNVTVPPASAKGDPDQLLVVDCLLPAQVRKMGQKLTMLMPRHAIKTSQVECEIRGGEYVSYDRADLSTALAIWQGQANSGDPKAQTYVGEIYERGLGVPPDYALAATWYRKAADQGYAPAMVNLGQLYERGQGVPQDVAVALDWYRKASGLGQLELPFVSDVESQEMVQLRKELGASQQEVSSLRAELKKVQDQLRTSQRQKARTEQELSQAKQRVDAQRQQVAQTKQAVETTQEQLAKDRNELARQPGSEAVAARIQERETELSRLGKQLDARVAEMKEMEASYADKRARITELEQEIQHLDATAAERRKALARTEAPKTTEIAVAGPSIQMIDPRLSASVQRGEETVKTPASKRPVIGQVEAGAGLLSLMVNDREVPVGDEGIFRTDIEVPQGGTQVTVVAVDNAGKRAERSFRLDPAAQPTRSTPPPALPAIDFGSYHALVIGNNKYQHLPPLKTARADARDLSAVLKNRYGFQVTTLYDATRYQILDTLNQLRSQLTSHDNLLIYYAGHGELDELNQRGHWLPVDAERTSSANWISNTQLTDVLNAMSAKHVLVIADSCYSGSLTRSALARLDAGMTRDARIAWQRTIVSKRSRMALTSGGLQPVLDGGAGVHSVFAKALLDVLDRNDDVLEGARLYQEVSALVAYAAQAQNFDQLPQYAPIKFAGHESGDFFFVPSGAASQASGGPAAEEGGRRKAS